MFHIIDKTYLGYNGDLQFGTDCIQIVSNGADHVAYDSEVGKLLSGNVSRRIAFAKSIDELIAHLGSADILFSKLINYKGNNHRDEFIVWCDPENYKQFVCRWLKTLMPNADLQHLKTVYNTYKNHELYVTRHLFEFTPGRTPSSEYWTKTDAELDELFKLPAFELTIDYKKYCSIEFQVASYAANKQCSVATDLMEKFYKIAQRRVVSDLHLIKSELEYYLYDLDLIWSELGYQDYHNLDVQKMIELKPGLTFLGDTDFHNLPTLKALAAKYEIKELCKIAKEFIAWNSFKDKSSDFICLEQFIANGHQVVSPDEIVESELKYKGDHRTPPYLGPMIEKKKINGHLFSFIAELYEAGEKDRLNQLSLDKIG